MPKKTIYQQIEEEEKSLEAHLAAQADAEPEKVEELPEPVKEEENPSDDVAEPEGEAKPESEPEPTLKTEDPAEKPEKKEPVHTQAERSEFIRLRQEAAEAKRKAREANEELARLREAQAAKPAPQATPAAKAPDPEPNKEVDYEAWVEWNLRQVKAENDELRARFKEQEEIRTRQEEETSRNMMFQRAKLEIHQYEEGYRQKAQDYDDAAAFLQSEIKKGIRLSNPWFSQAQVDHVYERQVVNMCVQFARAELDPAEQMYILAKANGYTKAEAEAPAGGEETPVKTRVDAERIRLEAIRKNKVVKTGLVAGGKSGTNGTTRDDALKMSNAKFSRLSAAELRELNEMD